MSKIEIKLPVSPALDDDQVGDEPNATASAYSWQAVYMTLARIAYEDPRDIQRQLAYTGYATGGEWALRWLGVSTGNQMYVAQNVRTKQWVVAIRGSVTDPSTIGFWDDWFRQDVNVFHQVQPPFSAPPGALIASGALDGFNELIRMTSGGQNLVQFLRANVALAPSSLVVLGHSLGGALATVVAPYLYQTLCVPAGKPAECIVPVTFAGPTVGNQQYATYVATLFNGLPFRCFNDLDVVPHCWALTGLDWVWNSYSPAPEFPWYLWAPFKAIYDLLWGFAYNYTQPGRGNPVAGQLQGECWWYEEAGYQHSGKTYLGLYGAPNVVPSPPQVQPTEVGPKPELLSV